MYFVRYKTQVIKPIHEYTKFVPVGNLDYAETLSFPGKVGR